jgi:hypothetical protein
MISFFATVVAASVILGVWAGVHLLARKQMGERKLGCRGPVQDSEGNSWCCKDDGTLCEEDDAHHRHLPEPR